MTDYEIITALECHNQANSQCEECPAHSLNSWWCFDHVTSDALKLIKRQNADIDKLNIELQAMRSAANSLKMHYEESQAEIERLKDMVRENEGVLPKYENLIKSEAVKEFAERICDGRVSNDPVVIAVKVELE